MIEPAHPRGRWLPFASALTGVLLFFTVVLGYGGDNFLVSTALPLPVLWVVAALLALTIGPAGLLRFWRHHRVLSALWLAAFAGGTARLFVDLAPHGLWALRQSIFFIATVGLFIGMHLGWRRAGHPWVLLVAGPIALILLYTLTFPWRDQMHAISPVSGAFVPVALLGHYQYFPIAVAAAWAALFADRGMNPLTLALLGASLIGVAIVQQRLGYAAIATGSALGLAAVVRPERLQWIGLRSTVGAWAIAVFLTASILFPLKGPHGAFDPEFLTAHLNTVLGRHGPAVGSMLHRYAEYPIAVERLFDQPWRPLLAGNGLGATIDLGVTGIYRTKLHLDYVEVIYRIGAAGMLWIATIVGLTGTFLYRLRGALDAPATAPRERRALLMIAGALVMSLVMAAFEPLFFWAYGAVPFFVYAGLGLGVLDRLRAEAEEPAAEPAVGRAPAARLAAGGAA